MRPADFAVWLKGAYDILGDRDPTPLERQCIHERLNETLADIARDKMFRENQLTGEASPAKQAQQSANILRMIEEMEKARMLTPREQLLEDLEKHKVPKVRY